MDTAHGVNIRGCVCVWCKCDVYAVHVDECGVCACGVCTCGMHMGCACVMCVMGGVEHLLFSPSKGLTGNAEEESIVPVK